MVTCGNAVVKGCREREAPRSVVAKKDAGAGMDRNVMGNNVRTGRFFAENKSANN